MARFIVNVLAMVAVLLLGSAVFGINPRMSELFLVGIAWIIGDFFEALVFGERR
jgi:hypothetical protein